MQEIQQKVGKIVLQMRQKNKRRVMLNFEGKSSLLLLAILNLTILIMMSANRAIYIPVNHLDGEFQTASGLFRVIQGQIPGLDFFPYLGIGPLLLLFPGFFAAGADLSSSVFASHFITLLILQLSIGITYFLLKKSPNCKEVLIGTLSIFYICSFLIPIIPITGDISSFIGINALSELSLPGNSLRPVRAFSVWIIVFLIYALSSRKPVNLKNNVAIGILLALTGTLWSNDYALVAMTMGFVVVLFSRLNSKRICKSCIFQIFGSFCLTLGIAFLVFMTNGLRESYFAYNYLDVRKDQFWYFGPWGNQFRIFDIQDLLNLFWKDKLIFPLVILVITLRKAIRSRDLKDLSLLAIGCGLFLGGSLATIGGHIYIYYDPFKLWGLLILGNYLLIRVQITFESVTKIKSKNMIFTGLIYGLSIFILIQETNSLLDEKQLAKQNGNYEYNENLGGFVDKNFLPKSVGTGIKQGDLIEEYAGLESFFYRTSNANKVDSVIHALGKQRLEFEKSINSRPLRVITSSPEVGDWFAWNISANWWFYRTLFSDYSAEINSPLTLKWSREVHMVWPTVDCAVTDLGRGIVIQPTNPDFYEVTIEYTAVKSGQRQFSMIQNNLNIVQSPEGYLALDPSKNIQSFPIAGFDGATNLKLVDVSKSDGFVTKIKSCTANRIFFNESGKTKEILDGLIKPSSSPANFSDQNWNSGVSKAFAGFFVRDRPANHDLFKIGSTIKFSNGDERTIRNVTFIEGFINVFLEGEILDPRLYGYPNKFTPIER